MKKRNARTLVRNRLERLAHIESDRPGAIKKTPMLWAFIYAINPELRP